MGNNTSKLDVLKATSFVITLTSLITMFRNRDRIRAVLTQNLTRLFHTINENPYLQTIAIPSGFGFFMYLSRTIWYHLYNQIRLWLYCSVSISSKDRNFGAVVDFVSKLHVSQINEQMRACNCQSWKLVLHFTYWCFWVHLFELACLVTCAGRKQHAYWGRNQESEI